MRVAAYLDRAEANGGGAAMQDAAQHGAMQEAAKIV